MLFFTFVLHQVFPAFILQQKVRVLGLFGPPFFICSSSLPSFLPPSPEERVRPPFLPLIRAAILDPEGPAFLYIIPKMTVVCGLQKCFFKIFDIIAQCFLQPCQFYHNVDDLSASNTQNPRPARFLLENWIRIGGTRSYFQDV